jgi:hypothetical protein
MAKHKFKVSCNYQTYEAALAAELLSFQRSKKKKLSLAAEYLVGASTQFQ